MTLLQACLNGVTTRRQHPRVPYTPEEVADQARLAVAAGAEELHIHPRDPGGSETFAAKNVAATLAAVRQACPEVPVGVSTGLWVTGQDPVRRLAQVMNWKDAARPDFASVNVREEGSEQLAAALLGAEIGVEAGVWNIEDAELLAAGGEIWDRARRFLIEPRVPEAEKALEVADEIAGILEGRDRHMPQLHHGAGATTWPIMTWAIERGHDIRIGLEDTTFLPDDRRAEDNEELVALAAGRLARQAERPAVR